MRHGITYEKDALLLNIHETSNHKSMDVIGRSVVLAFRFSGIQAEFPGIVTEKEIATSESKIVHFRKWHPSKEDKLKHFKGEIWGTQSIYVSSDKKYSKNRTLSAARKQAKKAIDKAEGSEPEPSVSYIAKFIELMEAGPKWCSDVIDLEQKFVKNELLETLKTVHSMLEEIEKESLHNKK